MLFGNTQMTIEKRDSFIKYDEYGMPLLAESKQSRCSVVKLDIAKIPNSDTNKPETTASSVILAELSADVDVGDRVVVLGVGLKVLNKQIRYETNGVPHHIQLGCSIWQ